MANKVRILAFDTSSTACSVALLNSNKQGGDRVISLQKIWPRQQAQLILPMILDLLNASSLILSQLDAIAFGCGPGSFTGVRIASNVAQGIGFAITLPIIRVSSLAAIAQAAYLERGWAKLLVCLDAHMGQVYWAMYQVNSRGHAELIGQERIVCLKDIPVLQEDGWYGVGEGWGVYLDVLTKQLERQPQQICPEQLPSAHAVAQLAKAKFENRDWVMAEEAIPAYLSV
jgi:tRNA threonylcarbamoyladenosine biosynthesis protein TsaB